MFYFGSWQETRQRNGVSSGCASLVTLPPLTNDRSAGALGKLFSGQRGYFNSQLGAGPAILADGSNINPAALKILQTRNADGTYLIPTPTFIDPSAPFDTRGQALFSVPCPFTEEQFMGNADYQSSSASKWAIRAFVANSTATQTLAEPGSGGGAVPGFPYMNGQDFRNFSIAHTRTFSPSLLNQAQIGFNRVVAGFEQVSPFKFSDFGINAPPFDNADPVIGIGTLNGGVGIGGTGQSVRFAQNVFVAHDLVAWTREKHSLRLGGGVVRSQDNEPRFAYPGIIQSFTFADFLLGLNAKDNGSAAAGLPASNVNLTVDLPGDATRAYRALEANLFLQDDWKITSNLTINAGLRYERLGDISDANGRNSAFDIALADPNPPATGTLAGYTVPSNYKGPLPPNVVRLNNSTGIQGLGQNTWDPRAGFAWQLPRTNRFVLRGGYGTFHSRYTGSPLLQSSAAPPFALGRILIGPDNASASLQNPFPATAPSFPVFVPYSPTTSLTPYQGFGQNFRPAAFYRYSIDAQVQLGHDFLWDVGYVGAHGADLGEQVLPNQAQLASASDPIRSVTTNTVQNVPMRVPYRGIAVSGLLLINSVGESWYDGVVTSLTKSLSHGLQFQASYTFARDLTTEPGVVSSGLGAGRVYGDQFHGGAHYGPDTFIRPHRFVVSYVYDVPYAAKSGSLTGRVFGAWSISGVVTAQSGQRGFATYSNSANVYGITQDRPNFVPGCTVALNGAVQKRLAQYFNTACFTQPAVIGDDRIATAFGNAPIGNIIGPRQLNVDMAVFKSITVPFPGDSARIEFRAEAFNAFNHPQFGNPGSVFGGASFGQILSTSVTPRILQLALRYRF